MAGDAASVTWRPRFTPSFCALKPRKCSCWHVGACPWRLSAGTLSRASAGRRDAARLGLVPEGPGAPADRAGRVPRGGAQVRGCPLPRALKLPVSAPGGRSAATGGGAHWARGGSATRPPALPGACGVTGRSAEGPEETVLGTRAGREGVAGLRVRGPSTSAPQPRPVGLAATAGPQREALQPCAWGTWAKPATPWSPPRISQRARTQQRKDLCGRPGLAESKATHRTLRSPCSSDKGKESRTLEKSAKSPQPHSRGTWRAAARWSCFPGLWPPLPSHARPGDARRSRRAPYLLLRGGGLSLGSLSALRSSSLEVYR